MEQTFTGKITEIRPVRGGTSQKGNEWANAEFEVTELNAEKPEYAQKALFDFFKTGEYLKYAKDFETYYKLGDTVTVHFNFKANEYKNKDDKQVKFYKTSAWKIDKINASTSDSESNSFEPAGDLKEEDDNLPF